MAPSPPSSSSSSATTTSVQVALRIRPTTSADTASIPARFQRSVIHAASSTSVNVDAASTSQNANGSAAASATAASSSKKQVFTFDQVHPPTTTQHALFTATAQPLITRFVDEGYNCTILAYGQTSSGKTFTMTGVDLDANPSDPNNGMGIIPRAVANIFARARKLKEQRGASWNYSIKGSFIEIYNEDLIDLLGSDDMSGGRREVQIREDKDGHIIWGGLREVAVKNSNEVMNLIRQGTSIRRTNETDMNAQSSRSHAIFSLTLTQKKYTGSTPPRSSSPLPPGGRSPSRLTRPGSVYTGPGGSPRISSPPLGRPSTPSFASAIGRGGGLRPASSLGLHPPDRRGGGDDDSGEWVTIVSKFHFVDLAGSERLKRTAAAGERIREGISINSGLLALGNVISALGDPSRAKSHTATHIPYRDSKLTRLLQDSLGGNAHTLMIACVSPTEWNLGETVNTLKYANRARNIKNRTVVVEKEEGWDDIEWLQGMVARLRKELKGIKEGGGISISSGNTENVEGAGKRVLAQMTELQNNYEDLREKFVQRTEELTRLRQELGERQRTSSSGAIGGTAKYEEIVGPVIEEYEKAIGAMEAELNLNRAALSHTNDMVEEKEEELAIVTERHAATELYIEELRSRVAKLTEREASTEAYVRDLEEKIKSYDETSLSSSESMTDLKREVVKYKDAEAHSSKYIASLEARLARSDESVLALQRSIEAVEQESERRRVEVEVLQARLDALKQDGASWRGDLEERERKVHELEVKLKEWERKKAEAADERIRLGNVVGEVVQARKSLEDLSPTTTHSVNDSGLATPNGTDLSLENQLVALQETHTATLADLSSVTAKYRDALREISDLAAQIQEAKVNNSPLLEEVSLAGESSPSRRRMTSARSREPSDAQGRRLFFRQAASAESLHTRSLSQSQSLSQELSSARSRKTSISSHGTSSSVSHSPTHKPTLSIALPGALSPSERSVVSLEKEIMRLQEVLKEREAEISILEGSLKEKDKDRSVLPSISSADETDDDEVNPGAHLSPKTMNKFAVIRKSMEFQNGYGHLNGHTNGYSSPPDADESLIRLNELMLSMAQKESAHKELVDGLNDQLIQIRRQHDDLTMLSRDQAINMSAELEALRSKHNDKVFELEKVQERETQLLQSLAKAEADHATAIEGLRKEHEEALRTKETEVDELLARIRGEHETSINDLCNQLSEASATLERSHQEHTEAFGKLKAGHEEELRLRVQEVNDVLGRARHEHSAVITKMDKEHEEELKKRDTEASDTLHRTEEEYYNALTKLRIDHSEAMEKQTADAALALSRLREEHTSEMRMAEIAREGSLSESQTARAAALKELQDEHAAAIARKEANVAEEIQNLKTEHAQIFATKDADYNSKIERLKSKHTNMLAIKDEGHEVEMDRLRLEHAGMLSKFKEESDSEVQRLNSSLDKSKLDSAAELKKVKEDHDAALQLLREHQASVLQEVERGHQEEVAQLKNIHEDTLKDAQSQAEQERSSLLQSHSEELTRLKEEHSQAIYEVKASLASFQQQSNSQLEASRSHSDQLSQELQQLTASLSDLRERYSQERDTRRQDHELILQELESHEATASELAQERDALAALLSEAEKRHQQEQDSLRSKHDLLTQELESHKVHVDELSISHRRSAESHEKALSEKDGAIAGMKQELASSSSERETLQAELAKLREELENSRKERFEASRRGSLVGELEKHRSIIAEMQENLQRVKDEKDNIHAEKIRQDSTLRDLQAQISRISHQEPQRPVTERNGSFTRSTALPAMKPPPPTPPPSVPPPPVPKAANGDVAPFSPSTQASTIMSSSSSRDSTLDSPATSTGHSLLNGSIDAKVTARLEEQAKHIDEQEVMIKTLNKQLSHCESDLQAHMDLVTTLETSLGDSEKNLRKVRMQATELARERDHLTGQIEGLRNELQEAKREVVTVRKSIVEEKQSLESRLDEERRAKERARQQLDTRMEELQKRKSKFACL